MTANTCTHKLDYCDGPIIAGVPGQPLQQQPRSASEPILMAIETPLPAATRDERQKNDAPNRHHWPGDSVHAYRRLSKCLAERVPNKLAVHFCMRRSQTPSSFHVQRLDFRELGIVTDLSKYTYYFEQRQTARHESTPAAFSILNPRPSVSRLIVIENINPMGVEGTSILKREVGAFAAVKAGSLNVTGGPGVATSKEIPAA